jgi:glycosyltransferase involved in cell wall biosynthesis
VLATSVGGVPDLIQQGVTGLLVSPRDERAMATALARLAADSALRATLGAKGRSHVAQQHAASRLVERMEDLYRRAITARRGGR